MLKVVSASPSKPFGFPRDRRLLTPADYRAVFRSGRRLHDRHWMLVIASTGDDAPARLGLAISKKCAKRAVDRNRIKRITREWFRAKDFQGINVVVTGKRGLAELSTAALRASLESLERRKLS